DLERSPEQEALAATLQRFLADRAPIRPYVREMAEDALGTTPEVWKGLADLGLTGMLVPESHGGAGMGMVDMGVALEEMGKLVHPGPFISSAVGAVSMLNAVGSPGETEEMSSRLAEGSMIATVAIFEPGSRARWKSPGTRASLDPKEWRLTGSKAFVPDGAMAEMILVTAATGDGLGLFAVESGSEGLEVAPVAVVDGTRKQAHLTLDGVRSRRIGSGDATGALGPAIDRLLAALVADGLGAAERTLEMAVDYAKERVQFDRVIGSFQAVQHMCADMLQAVELSRAATTYALWCCDAAEPAESHRAATMAKAYAGDALAKVGASAIQVLGGIGFTWEHD
ncbi:MAG: acyl-CoA dehydrogenase family protein, partial [Acidimicrobiales bacterium]